MEEKKRRPYQELSDQERLDLLETPEISIYDLHEDMQTVDDIPMDELNQKVVTESSQTHLNRFPGMNHLERDEQSGEK